MTTPDESRARPGDLDPLDDPERWEALVAGIGARAEPLLAARRPPPGIVDLVARWARPALAAAASFVILAGVGTVALGDAPSAEPAAEFALAPAMMPAEFADWLTGATQPSVAELSAALDGLEVDPGAPAGAGGGVR